LCTVYHVTANRSLAVVDRRLIFLVRSSLAVGHATRTLI
jgi:hypothetical protein